MMRNSILAAFVLLLVAPAANAASVRMELYSPYYFPGSTITLDVYVTSFAPETDFTVNGLILYDASVVAPATQTQYGLPPGDWTLGALTCTTTFCRAFSQIHVPGPVSVNVTDFKIATLTWTIATSAPMPLVTSFTWLTTPSTQRLDFFGLTNAPGVTITYIPEPGPAALLALGLLGMAVACRAQRTRTVAAARR